MIVEVDGEDRTHETQAFPTEAEALKAQFAGLLRLAHRANKEERA